MAAVLDTKTDPAAKFDTQVDEQLAEATSRIRFHDITFGALLAAGMLLAYFTAMIVLDKYLVLPEWVRQLALGTFLSVDWAFMTDLIPKAEAGRYMGVSNIATASAGLIARPILGPIIDAFNNNRTSAVGYRVMFGIVTGFFLIALLTLQPVREIKVE